MIKITKWKRVFPTARRSAITNWGMSYVHGWTDFYTYLANNFIGNMLNEIASTQPIFGYGNISMCFRTFDPITDK